MNSLSTAQRVLPAPSSASSNVAVGGGGGSAMIPNTSRAIPISESSSSFITSAPSVATTSGVAAAAAAAVASLPQPMDRYDNDLDTVDSDLTSRYQSVGMSRNTKTDNDEYYEDRLTVFQAEPLVYWDDRKVPRPMGRLDFEYEKKVLLDAIHETSGTKKIDVRFEKATTDRLSAFLARGEDRVLHFSCHGHPNFLGLEDGWGAVQYLEVSSLREWITHGGRSLHFVFVSACHSRSIGQAFVDAGVPHVVCCSHDSHLLRADAAIEFQKAFYRALGAKRFLRDAFELARQEIGAYSNMRGEMEKYCLLPGNQNHNVPVFFADGMMNDPSRITSRSLSSFSTNSKKRAAEYTSILPPAPEDFVGRDCEMFRVIQSIKETRLVRVSGGSGIGKSTLVKACCYYLKDRLELPVVNLQEILWVPFDRYFRSEGLYDWFEALFEAIRDEESDMVAFRIDVVGCIKNLIDYFKGKRSLLVVEAKGMTGKGMTKLGIFLEDLLRNSTIKVIVIHRPTTDDGVDFSTRRMPCPEADVEVGALDVSSTVRLFGRMCQYVADRRCAWIGNHKELHNFLIRTPIVHEQLSKRLSTIFEMIGNGVPDKIHHVARQMTPETYENLIEIGQRKEHNLKFLSRAAIMKDEEKYKRQLAEAVDRCDFHTCHEIQGILDEIELIQKNFPELHTLKSDMKNTAYERDKAISAKDWLKAGRYQAEMDEIERKIQVEKDALIAYDIIDAHEDNAEIFATRACLEAKIAELEIELEEAAEKDHFHEARRIDSELKRLEDLKPLRPSQAELSATVSQLEEELETAKQGRDWDTAEKICGRLHEVRKSLELEKQAETTLGTNDDGGDSVNSDDDEDNSNNGSDASGDGDDNDEGEDGQQQPEESQTRAYVDARIRELEEELLVVCLENNFDRARELDTEIMKYKELIAERPTRRELERQAQELETELDQAKIDRDWDKADEVFATLNEIKAKVENEKKVEEELGIQDIPDTSSEEQNRLLTSSLISEGGFGLSSGGLNRGSDSGALTNHSSSGGGLLRSSGTYGSSSGGGGGSDSMSKIKARESRARLHASTTTSSADPDAPGAIAMEGLDSSSSSTSNNASTPPTTTNNRNTTTSSGYEPLATVVEGRADSSATLLQQQEELPVASRVTSERVSKEQQKDAIKTLVQEKKHKMWEKIRREVLIEELKNFHAAFLASGYTIQKYLRKTMQSSSSSKNKKPKAKEDKKKEEKSQDGKETSSLISETSPITTDLAIQDKEDDDADNGSLLSGPKAGAARVEQKKDDDDDKSDDDTDSDTDDDDNDKKQQDGHKIAEIAVPALMSEGEGGEEIRRDVSSMMEAVYPDGGSDIYTDHPTITGSNKRKKGKKNNRFGGTATGGENEPTVQNIIPPPPVAPPPATTTDLSLPSLPGSGPPSVISFQQGINHNNNNDDDDDKEDARADANEGSTVGAPGAVAVQGINGPSTDQPSIGSYNNNNNATAAQDDVDDDIFSNFDDLGPLGGLATTDDFSHIEQIVQQTLFDMSVPAATVVPATPVLPDPNDDGRQQAQIVPLEAQVYDPNDDDVVGAYKESAPSKGKKRGFFSRLFRRKKK